MSRFITVDWDELSYAWHRLKRRLTPRVLREAADYVKQVDREVKRLRRKKQMAELEAYEQFYPGSLNLEEYLDLLLWRAEQSWAADYQRQIFGSQSLMKRLAGIPTVWSVQRDFALLKDRQSP